MLIYAGNYERTVLSSVEIFDPRNPSLKCTLPDMTVKRNYHASVGTTVCGDDGDGRQSCESLDGQGWTVSHTLKQYRADHVMWQSPSLGMMILGGSYSYTGYTVETLQDDGSSVMQQWKLIYNTRYGDITNIVNI